MVDMRAKIVGRAETEEEKKEVLDNLLKLWKETPSLRLIQLIINSISSNPKHQGNESAMYYIEDYELIKIIQQFIDKNT
jgi:hypothetical protein